MKSAVETADRVREAQEKSTERYREAVEKSRKRCREAEEKSMKGSLEAEEKSRKRCREAEEKSTKGSLEAEEKSTKGSLEDEMMSAKRCRGSESSIVKHLRERTREEHRVNVVVRIGSEHFDVRLLPMLKESSYFRRRVETMLTSSAMSNGCPSVLYKPLPVGAAAASPACSLRLLPLLNESQYFMTHVDEMFTSLAKSDGSPLIIDIPTDSPCTPHLFKIVIDFCYDRMEESEFSNAKVIKLIVVSEFLGMENLRCRALRFLEVFGLTTWDACLSILSSFQFNSLSNAGSGGENMDEDNLPLLDAHTGQHSKEDKLRKTDSLTDDQDLEGDGQTSKEGDHQSEKGVKGCDSSHKSMAAHSSILLKQESSHSEVHEAKSHSEGYLIYSNSQADGDDSSNLPKTSEPKPDEHREEADDSSNLRKTSEPKPDEHREEVDDSSNLRKISEQPKPDEHREESDACTEAEKKNDGSEADWDSTDNLLYSFPGWAAKSWVEEAFTEAEKNNNGANEYRHMRTVDGCYDQNDFPKTDSNFDKEGQNAVEDRGYHPDLDSDDEGSKRNDQDSEGSEGNDQDSDRALEDRDFLESLYEELFEICKSAFLEKIARPIPHLTSPSCSFKCSSENITRPIPHLISPSCSFTCFLNIAKILPMDVAERVYRSMVFQNYGLYDDTNRPIHLCQHYSISGLPVEGFAILCPYHPDRVAEIAGLINHLRNLLDDLSRRALLVTYLARLILPNKSRIENVSVVCFDFLCALLVEATELSRDLEDEAPASALEVEIEWMEVLVGQFFDTGCTEEIPGPYSGPTLYSGTHRIQPVLAKFSFSTLLSIVTHLRAITNEERRAGVAKIFDTCFTAKLEEKSLAVQQVLQIYEEFPNDGRPSHDKIFQVFADSLAKQAMTPEEIHRLAELLDYNKLSNEVLERLCGDFGLGWNRLEPRFQERVVKMQQEKEAKAQGELLRLGGELRKKSSDLDILNQHIVRMTTQLRVARSDIQKEKEKTSCRICFVNPRDTLVLPCLHFHYCRQCLQNQEQVSRTRTCPTCRGVIRSTLNCIT